MSQMSGTNAKSQLAILKKHPSMKHVPVFLTFEPMKQTFCCFQPEVMSEIENGCDTGASRVENQENVKGEFSDQC